MLSKEEIENNKLSVSIPLITDEETRQIDNNFDNVIEQFNKQIIHDKDLAMAQYIIQKQQDKIDQLESDKQKLIEKLVKDKIELTEELKYNITKREARMQLNLVNKYLEMLK